MGRDIVGIFRDVYVPGILNSVISGNQLIYLDITYHMLQKVQIYKTAKSTGKLQ